MGLLENNSKIMNPENNDKVCEGGGHCGGCCKCMHHSVAPIAVMLIGVAFLLQAFGVLQSNIVSMAWPVLLIVAASTKMCKCCGKC